MLEKDDEYFSPADRQMDWTLVLVLGIVLGSAASLFGLVFMVMLP